LEVNIRHKSVSRREFHQEGVSLDKIVNDSDSKFYITGRTTKVGFINLIQLVSKHNINEVDGMEQEEVVLSSDLLSKIASASVVDEDDEFMRYIDAGAVGVFFASFLLSIFGLVIRTTEDLRTFSWILLFVSVIFLANYTYRGIRSGEIHRVWRLLIKSLTRR
jgi:hypothetical protein